MTYSDSCHKSKRCVFAFKKYTSEIQKRPKNMCVISFFSSNEEFHALVAETVRSMRQRKS
jgi:hypothetical protein